MVAKTVLSASVFVTLATLTALSACGDTEGGYTGETPLDGGRPSSPAPEASAPSQPLPDAGPHDAGDAGDGGHDGGSTCKAPAPLGRGLAWVRSNPMMIAGLSVFMGAPSTSAVSTYFDEFHASAVHLWENGLPAEITAWSQANHPRFRYVSWVHFDGKSVANGEVLGGMAPLPGRIGYQISDEPQNAAALAQIAAGLATVKAADPDGLRIVNLNDGDGVNAIRKQAAEMADVDLLSYDHYTWNVTAHNGLSRLRSAALAAGKPYWRYMDSYHAKSEAAKGAESDFRWDAFVGAVHGFTGYSWFVYSIEANSQDLAPDLFAVGGNYEAAKTERYTQVAAINRELAVLGRALVMLRSVDVRYLATIALLKPVDVAAWSKGAGADPYLAKISLTGGRDLAIGHFRDDCDEPYVLVQNQGHAGAAFPNNGGSSATYTLEFDFAGSKDPSLDKTSISVLDPKTGAVGPRPLTSAGADKAKLDVTLAAGDVLFFKYSNARSFALQ